MRYVFILLILTCLISPAYGWEIRSRYGDLGLGDGFEPGSAMNPYEIYDSYGTKRGSMSPRYEDYGAGDIYSPGSYVNPYEVKWDRY